MTYVKAYAVAPRKIAYIDKDGQQTIYFGGTRAWRTNNPGNIMRGNFASKHRAIGDDGVNAIFSSREDGLAALFALLGTATYRELTIAAAIRRYAPPEGGNETEAYQRFVADRTGLALDRTLASLDRNELERLAGAIQAMEGWKEGEIIRPDHNAPDNLVLSALGFSNEWMSVANAEAALPKQERSEWPDPRENPRILRYFASCTWFKPEQGDEEDWCASFVNWCLSQAGYHGTNHPGARSFSWDNWGKRITDPVYGCIAVFQDLPNDSPGWKTGKGHVGFVTRWDSEALWLLGGNQGNTVQESRYPIKTDKRILHSLKLPLRT